MPGWLGRITTKCTKMYCDTRTVWTPSWIQQDHIDVAYLFQTHSLFHTIHAWQALPCARTPDIMEPLSQRAKECRLCGARNLGKVVYPQSLRHMKCKTFRYCGNCGCFGTVAAIKPKNKRDEDLRASAFKIANVILASPEHGLDIRSMAVISHPSLLHPTHTHRLHIVTLYAKYVSKISDVYPQCKICIQFRGVTSQEIEKTKSIAISLRYLQKHEGGPAAHGVRKLSGKGSQYPWSVFSVQGHRHSARTRPRVNHSG